MRILQKRPPAEALAWAADAVAPGSRVVRVRAMSGGVATATHVVDVEDRSGRRHSVVLRRWARPGCEQDDPEFTPAREAAVLERLAGSTVPAPRLVAVDPDGSRCDVPALLVTRLPGRARPRRAPLPPATLDQLGSTLAAIHRLDLGAPRRRAAVRPLLRARPDRPAARDRPSRSVAPRNRRMATAPARSVFMHRDFHPGNTLWHRGRLTGVVDWTLASWGLPAADLAHLRANLGIDHGVEAADRAREAFVAAGGDVSNGHYWDIVMVLDLGDDLFGDGLDRVERYLEALLD